MCTEHFCKITCKRIIIIILLLLLLWWRWRWRNRTLYTLLEAVVVVGGATAHVLSLLPQQNLLRCTRLSWRWDDDEEKRLARLQLLLPRQIIITNRNVTIKLAKPGRVVCKTSNQAEAVHSWIALVRYFPLMMTTTTTRQPFRRLPCHCTGWCIVRSLLLLIIRRASLYPVYQSFAVAIILSIHYTYIPEDACLLLPIIVNGGAQLAMDGCSKTWNKWRRFSLCFSNILQFAVYPSQGIWLVLYKLCLQYHQQQHSYFIDLIGGFAARISAQVISNATTTIPLIAYYVMSIHLHYT